MEIPFFAKKTKETSRKAGGQGAGAVVSNAAEF